MDYIDRKYVLLSSTYLDKFKDTGKIFKFRCVYCGDSQKNPNKTRGFFYVTDDNKTRYKCHNCQVNVSLYQFLTDHVNHLCRDYRMEKFKDNFVQTEKKDVIEFEYKKSESQIELENKIKSSNVLKHCQHISENESAYNYLLKRKLPKKHIDSLYYVSNINIIRENLADYANSDKLPDVEAIVIPFYNKESILTHVQVRMLNTGDSFRYLTFEVEKGQEKVWGMNNIDPEKEVFIFEGAFDAMCVENAIAVAGASLNASQKFYDDNLKNYTLVYDSDYVSNKDIFKQIFKAVEHGNKVVLYDEIFVNTYMIDGQPKQLKDVNDLVKYGIVKDISEYLIKNTYRGLKARLILSSLSINQITRKSKTWENQSKNSMSGMKQRLTLKRT